MTGGIASAIEFEGGLLPAWWQLGTAGEMHAGAWLSTDGRSWQPFGPPVPNAFFHTAHVTDGGLLALGATQDGTLATGIEAHAMLWGAILDE